jgi:two-component system, LuxR family, response regulator FixJ
MTITTLRVKKMTNKTPCIYIVDDDASVLKALTRLIVSNGLIVKAFDSGKKFLETYDKDLSGCIIVDVRMPGMTGLDLQKKLADMESTLPVIFITAHDDQGARKKAMENGAAAWLMKPVNEDDLLKAVAAVTS